MKNKLFFSLIMIFITCYLFAQDTLPNTNFENWTSYGAGLYEEPSGGVWTTANEIALLGMPQTTLKTTDAESGTYAAEMITAQTTLTSPPTLLTGTLATGIFNTTATPPANLQLGQPFTGRPVRFTGWYKYVNNDGDSCAIYAILSKWNGSSRQKVGEAKLSNADDTVIVSTYTQFNLPFTYYLPDTPDTISVVFASSAGGASMVGHVGSTLYIDNINLSYISSIDEIKKPSLNVQCYPVPSNSAVNFVLDRNVIEGSLMIFNELGSEVKKMNVTNKTFSVPVDDLSKGKYSYQILEKDNIIYSGSFLVN
jgi:hypothetical protein